MFKPRILVISGSMGAGKTTVMGEASDLLMAREIQHAAIDLDAISLPLLPQPLSGQVYVRNLVAIAKNCRDAGIDRFLLAVALQDRADLAELRRAFDADAVTVARLTAPANTMAARLRAREPGMRQEEFVDRSRHLDGVLTTAALEDFSIDNDRRPVTTVAEELLARAGWIE
jgi:ribose 1,5-bisphosphokinase PhnN